MAEVLQIVCPDCFEEFEEEIPPDTDPKDENTTIESECPDCGLTFYWGLDADGKVCYFDAPDDAGTADDDNDQDDEEEEDEDDED